MESVSSGSNTRCIVINASLRESSELMNFAVGCSVPKLTFYDNPSLCRLVLRIEIKGKKSAVQHLLIQTNQPICKILEGVILRVFFSQRCVLSTLLFPDLTL